MNVISNGKKKIQLEIDPLELEILCKAITRECRRHEYNWDKCVPEFPEELMYFADMRIISKDMKLTLSKLRKQYKD